MIRLIVLLCTLPAALWAAPPRVMTDIAPVHSLTAQVMGDLGTPDLLLPPDADPHDFALRPSDAQRLGDAELVIWVGPGLTSWLTEPLETLAAGATALILLDAPGWERLEVREKDDHDGHAHEGHDHGDVDPHGWLDPVVARAWIGAISKALGDADPDNAAQYARNAADAVERLNRLEAEIAAQLSPVRNAGYVLPHDGYHYFEHRFGLTAAGAIAGADGRTPGPAHVAELREKITQDGIACVFSDVEVGDRWAAVLTEGTDARTAQIDGNGGGLEPGPALYDSMLRRLAQAFATCLGAAS